MWREREKESRGRKEKGQRRRRALLGQQGMDKHGGRCLQQWGGEAPCKGRGERASRRARRRVLTTDSCVSTVDEPAVSALSSPSPRRDSIKWSPAPAAMAAAAGVLFLFVGHPHKGILGVDIQRERFGFFGDPHKYSAKRLSCFRVPFEGGACKPPEPSRHSLCGCCELRLFP